MNVRYRLELDQSEREQLTALLSGGKHAARKLKRAQILLAADAGVSDEAIATSLAIAGSTIYRTKRRFVEGNLEAALSEEPRPGAARKLTGKEEALLVATACSKPPEGRARWTLELLAGAMVKLTEHEHWRVSHALRARMQRRRGRCTAEARARSGPALPSSMVSMIQDVIMREGKPQGQGHSVSVTGHRKAS
jgi:transposase